MHANRVYDESSVLWLCAAFKQQTQWETKPSIRINYARKQTQNKKEHYWQKQATTTTTKNRFEMQIRISTIRLPITSLVVVVVGIILLLL